MSEDNPVAYAVDGPIARITLDRPDYRNAQNSKMTYALDEAFQRATNDDDVKVIVLSGAGKHFCAGHDIGTPGRDVDVEYERKAVIHWTHVGAEGVDQRWSRESEVYLGMCRRWREVPKPVIAQVHGACIAGGLMLAWVCDFIVASEDAFFSDPVVRMGIPGVEYFAHPWVMNPRAAKEFLYTGDRVSAQRAYELGMVNHVVPTDELTAYVDAMATRISAMPRLGQAGFNDAGTWVTIRRGEWQLCEHEDFRGECLTLGPGTHELPEAFVDLLPKSAVVVKAPEPAPKPVAEKK